MFLTPNNAPILVLWVYSVDKFSASKNNPITGTQILVSLPSIAKILLVSMEPDIHLQLTYVCRWRLKTIVLLLKSNCPQSQLAQFGDTQQYYLSLVSKKIVMTC